ncbi:MAG TPA: hypothetical protein VJ992_05840 [Gemmatimonadales bacterium]|nr:hypothetical protein [Gemmatimonadales bacterium]
MVDQSRRDLLKTLAKGAIYAAPFIATVSAPTRLMAQGPSMSNMGGMGMGPFAAPVAPAVGTQPPSSNASPGTQPPPGH